MNYVIDIDRVLADLDTPIFKHFYVEPDETGDWSSNIGMKDEDILQEVDCFEFWRDLPVLPWAYELVDLISSINDHWMFCSHPTNNPESWSGKAEWIQIHFPKYYDRLILTRDKSQIASHKHCLIDDYKVNNDAFQKRGGHVIPFPFARCRGLYNWTPAQLADPVGYIEKEIRKVETTRISR